MLRRVIGPLVFGVGGVAVLLALGFWQLDRLEWKLGVIAAIDARIAEAPGPLPAEPDPEADRYRAVTVGGDYSGEVVRVLSSRPGTGVGTLVIAVLETAEGRRVLVDRGFVADAAPGVMDFAATGVTVTGNLLWPADSDSYTPAPDLEHGLWFSREVGPIAAHLGTEPVLIVARQDARVPGLLPRPIASAEVKNDHLGYAVTWFLLAVVWSVMTIGLLWRNRRNTA